MTKNNSEAGNSGRVTLVGLCVNKKLLMACAVVALPLLVSSCGSGDQAAAADTAPSISTPSVLVEDAWVRTTAGAKDTTMTAAFMSLTNPGDSEIKLTSATSPVPAPCSCTR